MSDSTIIRTRPRRPHLADSGATQAGRKRRARAAKGSAVSALSSRHPLRPHEGRPAVTVVERSTAEIREVVQRMARHDRRVSLELKSVIGALYQVARLSELACEHGRSDTALEQLGALTLHLESMCTNWCRRNDS